MPRHGHRNRHRHCGRTDQHALGGARHGGRDPADGTARIAEVDRGGDDHPRRRTGHRERLARVAAATAHRVSNPAAVPAWSRGVVRGLRQRRVAAEPRLGIDRHRRVSVACAGRCRN